MTDYKPTKHKRYPAVIEIKKSFLKKEAELRIDAEMRKYATPTKDGYVMTARQMKEFMAAQEKKKKRTR